MSKRCAIAPLFTLLALLPPAATAAEVEESYQFAPAWEDSYDSDVFLLQSITLAPERELISSTNKYLSSEAQSTTLIFSAESSFTSPWACHAESDIGISNLTIAASSNSGLFFAGGELSLSSVTLLISAETADDTPIFVGESGVSLSKVSIDLTACGADAFSSGLSFTLFETGGEAFSDDVLHDITVISAGSDTNHASLSLANGGQSVILTLTPEPGSATLSLMALAALSLHRRRPKD